MDIQDTTNFSNFGAPELIIMAVLGLAVLLFGYRIKKIAFFIVWFILGYNLVGFLIPAINNLFPVIADSSLYQALLPIAGGLLLALLGFSIEKLCVAGVCFALIVVIAVRYFGTDIQVLATSGVVGVIVAGLAVTLMKPATIIATSAAGAYALTVAVLVLASNLNFSAYYWPMIFGITAIGAIFQFSTTKHVS